MAVNNPWTLIFHSHHVRARFAQQCFDIERDQCFILGDEDRLTSE